MFISYDSQLTAITKLPNFQRMIDSEGGLELTETKKGLNNPFKFLCRFLQSSSQLGVRMQWCVIS